MSDIIDVCRVECMGLWVCSAFRRILQMYFITTTVHKIYVHTHSLLIKGLFIVLMRRHRYCTTPFMFKPPVKTAWICACLLLAQNQVRLLLVALFSCCFPIDSPPRRWYTGNSLIEYVLCGLPRWTLGPYQTLHHDPARDLPGN